MKAVLPVIPALPFRWLGAGELHSQVWDQRFEAPDDVGQVAGPQMGWCRRVFSTAKGLETHGENGYPAVTGVFFWEFWKGFQGTEPPRGDFFPWTMFQHGKKPSAHQVTGVDTEVQDIWLRVRDHLNDAQDNIISSVKGEAEWDTTHGQLFSVLVWSVPLAPKHKWLLFPTFCAVGLWFIQMQVRKPSLLDAKTYLIRKLTSNRHRETIFLDVSETQSTITLISTAFLHGATVGNSCQLSVVAVWCSMFAVLSRSRSPMCPTSSGMWTTRRSLAVKSCNVSNHVNVYQCTHFFHPCHGVYQDCILIKAYTLITIIIIRI